MAWTPAASTLRLSADRRPKAESTDISRKPEILKPLPIGHFVEFLLRAGFAKSPPEPFRGQVASPLATQSGVA